LYYFLVFIGILILIGYLPLLIASQVYFVDFIPVQYVEIFTWIVLVGPLILGIGAIFIFSRLAKKLTVQENRTKLEKTIFIEDIKNIGIKASRFSSECIESKRKGLF